MLKKKLLLPFALLLVLILSACTANNHDIITGADKEIVEDDTREDEVEVANNEDNQDNEKDRSEYSNVKISPLEAFDIYMEKYPGTKVKKVEIDRDKEKYIYEVEGFDNEKEYELKIDPVNGEILDEDIDSRDDDKEQEITREQVEKIQPIVDKALKDVGDGILLEEWTLKIKNNSAQIEVEMEKDNGDDFEHIYDIDTGELLEIDD